MFIISYTFIAHDKSSDNTNTVPINYPTITLLRMTRIILLRITYLHRTPPRAPGNRVFRRARYLLIKLLAFWKLRRDGRKPNFCTYSCVSTRVPTRVQTKSIRRAPTTVDIVFTRRLMIYSLLLLVPADVCEIPHRCSNNVSVGGHIVNILFTYLQIVYYIVYDRDVRDGT